jgi:hypothetical protein
MKLDLARLRWILIMFIITLFAILQLLFQESGWAGGACVRSLTEPDEEAQASYEWTGIGFPLQYVSITEDGCFENRTTTVEWHFLELLIDVLVFASIGFILYKTTLRYQRVNQKSSS